MATKDPWWLKIERAEHHMVEIKDAIKAYADKHPYEALRINQPPSQQFIRRYKLNFTELPDEMISAMIGDFIHNVRSALDHVVVGRSKGRDNKEGAALPVRLDDPWEKVGRTYRFRNPETRKSFNRVIAGLSPEAQALVKRSQPYHEGGVFQFLAVINRLDNADKHRRIIVTAPGLEDAVEVLRFRGRIKRRQIGGPRQYVRDQAEFDADLPRLIQPPLQDSEVDVELEGTPAIVLRVSGVGPISESSFNLRETMNDALNYVTVFLRDMERL